MNCKECNEILPLVAMGEASEEAKAAVEAHLEDCAGCRAEYDDLRKIVGALSAASEDAVPEIDRLRLENRVLSQLVARSRRPEHSPWRGLLRLAAVLVIFILGFAARPAVVSILGEQPTTARVETATESYTSALTSGMRFSAAGLKVIARGKSAAPEVPPERAESTNP